LLVIFYSFFLHNPAVSVCAQDDAAAARWRERVEAIVEATAGAVRAGGGGGSTSGIEVAKL
jgi:hypothetical protein